MDDQQRQAYDRAIGFARKRAPLSAPVTSSDAPITRPSLLAPYQPGDRPEHYDEHGRRLLAPFVSSRTTFPSPDRAGGDDANP